MLLEMLYLMNITYFVTKICENYICLSQIHVVYFTAHVRVRPYKGYGMMQKFWKSDMFLHYLVVKQNII